MKPTTVAVLALTLATLGGGAWWMWGRAEPPPELRREQVRRADVRATVKATGTLEAVVTVEVGTQVSGTIQEVLVDFNDRVTKGQLLARLDTSILEADVQSASANLAVAEAGLAQAEAHHTRMQALHARQAATTQELEAARADHDVAQANLRAARVSLSRARQNLGYATITSPIDGLVVDRAIDQGQTVASSMTAPTLFTLAGDLARMQIVASVDEADIGRIQAGQAVDFTVQAWDEEHFQGTVRQVRLQSTTEENVVTYAVVVDVDNATGRLLPGMTATVDFIVAEAPDVLCVANAALRFRPDEALIAAEPAAPAAAVGGGGGEAPSKEDATATREGAPGGNAGKSGKGGGRRRGGGGGGEAALWLPTPEGKVRKLAVQTGLSDDTCTEVRGEGVVEGLEVAAGVVSSAEGQAAGSPFQKQGSGGPARPGGF
ncbi:efflux RND transporter periplasmic adaptor subunit [Myxococcota bacterium]|nr:efflux RND transporter periplasmic adaptor subunit [Myxococcota bacterium]